MIDSEIFRDELLNIINSTFLLGYKTKHYIILKKQFFDSQEI